MQNRGLHDFSLASLKTIFFMRINIFAVLNLIFFVSVFSVVFFGRLLFPPTVYDQWTPWPSEVFQNNFILIVLIIFLSNLALAAFLTVTLPGILFFPLSAVALIYKAVLWCSLLYPVSGRIMLAVLPTLFLEGEAYVISAGAGTIAGFSWLFSKKLYKEEMLSRKEAFESGLKECLRLYILVASLLLIAAMVETTTLMLLS